MIKLSIDRHVMQSIMGGVADQIKSKIDTKHVKKICNKRYGIKTIESVKHKDANIVVIDNQAACKLDFEVRFSMSIFITAKEDSNSILPENNDILDELDEIPEELGNMPEDLDEIMAEELDEIPEELEDMRAELDEIMAEELDGIPEVFDGIRAELDMSELKEEYLIDNDDKKPIKSS